MSRNPQTLREMLEMHLEELCDDYCKYHQEYFSKYEDPDEAYEKMMEEKCDDCPIGRII